MKMHKKAYALATTVVIMAFVFAISAIMVTLVAWQSSNAKKNVQVFEEKLAISQICTNFVDMPAANFQEYYQNLGYQTTLHGDKTVLSYAENPLSIVTNTADAVQTLWVVKNNNVSVALVQKSLGEVVTFTYEEKEFEL